MPLSLEKRFDEALYGGEAVWPKHNRVLIRAIKQPDGSQKFILPRPVMAMGRSPYESLRIEIDATVSMGDAAKILREIARDFAETDRLMRDPAAFVDHMLPLPRKKRFRTPLNGTQKKVPKSARR